MTDKKIMVIRHAEKPNGELGEAPDRSENEESLTATGWKRAKALVGFFNPGDGRFSDHIAKPTALFAAKPNARTASLRPEQTITPLSQAMPLNIGLAFGLGDEDALVAAAIGAAGVALIAWHHQKIPYIAGKILGSMDGVPARWKHKRFDLVWVFNQQADGHWSFHQVPQLLLPGDSDKPIK
jgi:hypothetical protein